MADDPARATGSGVGVGVGEQGDPPVAPAEREEGVECDAATVPLSDGDRARNLLGRYCDLMDAGDFAGVGALFGDGVLADERGRPLASGAAAIEAFYAGGTRLHDGSPRTKHLVLNTVLSPDDAGGELVARSSYLVLQAVDGALALQPIITGRYVDRFSADGSVWLERRFVVDLVGDLAHHLGFALPS